MNLGNMLNKSVTKDYILYDLFHLYEMSRIDNA